MKQISIRNLVLAAAAFCILYTVTGFFIVPIVAKKVIVNIVDTQLGRSAEITRIQFNPFTLSARLGELNIKDKNGRHFLSAQSITVDLSAASILKLAPVISGLELYQPAVSLALNADNTLSIDDLIGSSSQDTAPDQDADPVRFSIGRVNIREGRFEFSDQIRNKIHRIDQFNLDLTKVSNLPGEDTLRTTAELSLTLNKAGIQARAETRPFDPTMETQFSLKAGDIGLADYLAYVPLPEALIIASPGRADIDASGAYAKEGNGDTLSFDAAVKLKSLDIQTTDGPLLSCPELTIKAKSQNLFTRQMSIQEAVLNGPEIHLDRNAQGDIGVMTLLAGPETSESAEPAFPFRIKIARGGLENATVVFRDEFPMPKFETRLSDLNMMVLDLEMGADVLSGRYQVGFETDIQEKMSAQGRFSMAGATENAGPEMDGQVELKGIRPEKYRPYYRQFTGDQIHLGPMNLTASFKAAMEGADVLLQVKEGRLDLEDLILTDPKEKAALIDLKRIQLSGIEADLKEKSLTLGSVDAAGGQVRIARLASGKVNLAEAVKEFGGGGADQNSKKSAPSTRQWVLTLDKFSLADYQLLISDLTPREPVNLNLSDIRIDAAGISSAPGQEGKLSASMRFQDQGKIGFSGTLNLSDLGGAIDLDLSEIGIKSFEPYFTDYLKILINNGQFASNGRIDFSLPENDSFKLRFTGQAALTEFETKHKGSDIDFFRYKSLYLSGIDVSAMPVKVDIREISLTDFYHRSVLSKEGRLSITDILVEADRPADASASEAPGTPMDISIGTITVQGGHINFSDYFTTPNFTANMTEVAGSIKGLTSKGSAPAELQLKGLHGRHSPLDISGAVAPLKDDPFFDVMISFKNIELPEFNAYATKYLGYEIDKGKLILDLTYKIDGRELSSNNRLFFDQLTLGEKVESEDATSLPIQLAISLLKNDRGEIDLDLPISGNLDDPEFNYGDVVATTFKNFILGIVTAPFKFLGGLIGIGDDQDLGYVEFLPGSDEIDSENQIKIDQLVGILTEKDGLKIQIEGRYDPVSDGEHLRYAKYESLLVSMMQKGEDKKTVQTLAPEIRDALVAAAYAAAEFPKPRDASGNEKEISIQEKEKLLLTSMPIEETDLEAIAVRRSEQIREHMITQGKINPERIFLHDPDPVDEQDRSATRVKAWFLLK